MSPRGVAIVGAGVAGLAAALCFARKGIAADIFEQADALREVGAGLQISPNAARILGDLGLLDALRQRWSEPERVSLRSGLTLKRLADVDISGNAARWGAPYGVLHRATLQALLQEAVRREPLCSLHLGTRIQNAAADALTEHTGYRPDLVVGADGVWSKLRSHVPGAEPPLFSGSVAWRMTVPMGEMPDLFDRSAVTAFAGPSAHLVAYPLREADSFNLVAIHRAPDPGKGWRHEASSAARAALAAAFSGWHGDLAGLLARVDGATFWPLHSVEDGRWYDDRECLLIGDAAHAMTPFAAQGAAMAIEDAAELAATLADDAGADLAGRLRSYESERRRRVARVRSRGRLNALAYHAAGPLAVARDLLLAMRSPASLAADLDWLYGYRTRF
ncbi:FAD-dependent monooxygenase [Rhizobium sp. TRM95111]|uniref:FAD-dependent monooxygenase n=1 Tax=Rhizobium alarense TaxID=2846851 RepID=UPI001F2CC522|nr:FAD-dependent monooxygenase [Rhizobium alarense]MCF3639051.1 FAD-dependent monooxygenase [Rhizobium alarense]